MPSPAGHILSGLFLGAMPTKEGSAFRPKRLLLAALIAASADLDMLLVYVGLDYFMVHRTFSHSYVTVSVVFILLWAVDRYLDSRGSAVRIPYLLISACLAAHVCLDLLGEDNYGPRGLMIFWPFSTEFYYADINLIPAPFLNGKPLPFAGLAQVAMVEFFVISFIGSIVLFLGYCISRVRGEYR